MTAYDPLQTLTTLGQNREGSINMATSFGQRLLALAVAVSLLLVNFGVAAQQWMPPHDPDPRAIRKEADTDIQAGRFDLASEKYLWYHENALKYRPSLSGVRLSFALHDWRDLANQYPPALQDMQWIRDKAEESVRKSDDDFAAYQELVALNDVLKDDGRTIELFKWLDQHNRHFARSVYTIAQHALVDAGELALCEKYIVGDNSFESIMDDYERRLQWSDDYYEGDVDPRRHDFDQMFLTRRTAYIIAILVNLERSSEAAVIAETVLQALENETHKVQISDALEGIPPERLR